jgi:N6-adenosine-specific RNA methylase IME4
MLDQTHTRLESGPFAGLPRGHYRVALVDPPWTFHAWSHRGEAKDACQHYRCQSLEEIFALPVDQLMAQDAALFLWVVQPMLPEALRVALFEPIREHSRKPDEVARRIDQLVGDIPRIELFAREQRPGWSVWGDQVQLNLFGRAGGG